VVDLVWSAAGPVFLTGGGVVETLNPYRHWPQAVVWTDGEPQAPLPRHHLVHSAMAADAWEAVGSLVRADPTLLETLDPSEAVRAAFVSGDIDALDAALLRAPQVSKTTGAALRARRANIPRPP
jgi:hypothetical protein